ncbi:hypothetical protein [Variovorax paradoxus]|uniref:hypothetical protein n=1 Tax=Variovorax paradoxus TaxID=34073 RepID=UPI003A0FC246
MRALDKAIAACHGLFDFFAEYNHAIARHLKNAIDSTSRPGLNPPLDISGAPLYTVAKSASFSRKCSRNQVA